MLEPRCSDDSVISERVRAMLLALALVTPPDPVLRKLCLRVMDELPEARGVVVSLVGRDSVHVVAGVGYLDEVENTITTALPMSMCATVVARQSPIITSDAIYEDAFAKCIVASQHRGFAGYPVRFRGYVVGSLSASSPGVWGELDKARAVGVLASAVADLEREFAWRDAG